MLDPFFANWLPNKKLFYGCYEIFKGSNKFIRKIPFEFECEDEEEARKAFFEQIELYGNYLSNDGNNDYCGTFEIYGYKQLYTPPNK